MISVIVPVYKVELYLAKCIESIINQTYKELEIILVDDGSPDNCGKICDEYAKRDKRIKVIHKENGGLSSARNAGLDMATGDYIGFVDSDDYIAPNMYEKLLKKIEEENADVCVCNLEYVDIKENLIENAPESPLVEEVLDRSQILKKICSTDNNSFYYVTAVNKLYKKHIFEELRFADGRLHEDEFIAHHIYGKCSKVAILSSKLYYYVQVQGSIMNSSYSVKKLDAAYAFYDRYIFLKRNGFKQEAKKSLIVSYGQIMTSLKRLPYRGNEKSFNPILKDVLFNFNLGVRGIKLFFAFIRRFAIDTVSYYKFRKNTLSPLEKAKRSKLPCAIMMATPCHGNLGDQAIVYAEKKFLKLMGYQKNQIIEVGNAHYLKYGDELKKYIDFQDLIIIDGGGNLGILWPNEDDKIGKIISEYKNNKLIVFPQTIYYDNSLEAKKRLKENQNIYHTHSNLTILFREERSYAFAKENFPSIKSILCPDIVLSINEFKSKKKRHDILLCFRDDLEKAVKKEDVEKIKDKITKLGLSYECTSTIIADGVNVKNRKQKLNRKFDEFASSRLVITDRLHAMIFSAITSTPCIAIDNKSKKVSGVYEWIKQLEYVCCVDNVDEIVDLIELFYNKEDNHYIGLEKELERLRKEL